MSDEPLPIPEHAAQEVRDKLTEVLSRREFQPRGTSLLDRLSDRLGDILDRLLDPLSAPSIGSASVIDWLVMAALAVVVLLVVVRLTRTVRSGTVGRREGEASLAMPRSARAWLQEAEAHERDGAWREALRCRYRELVASLVERHVITDTAGRTAGEYRSEAGARLPHIAQPFAEATDLFEAAWYGNVAMGPNDTTRFRVLADRVLVLAGRRPDPSDGGGTGHADTSGRVASGRDASGRDANRPGRLSP